MTFILTNSCHLDKETTRCRKLRAQKIVLKGILDSKKPAEEVTEYGRPLEKCIKADRTARKLIVSTIEVHNTA